MAIVVRLLGQYTAATLKIPGVEQKEQQRIVERLLTNVFIFLEQVAQIDSESQWDDIKELWMLVINGIYSMMCYLLVCYLHRIY